jgi:phenylacetic acid degradation operon negative regulatory protein
MSSVKSSSNFVGDAWTPARRPDAGPSARALLLTLLGEFVLPGGGAAWTSTLVAAMGLVGVDEAAARQALARSAGCGLLTSRRSGRRTEWTLTAAAARLLTEGTERIYGFAAVPPPWDGRWLLVLTSVPEHNRHLRSRRRARMTWHGFGVLGPGAWVSPWADREPLAAAALDELGLTSGARSWVGHPGALGSVEERVGEIWDLGGVSGEYEAFVAGVRRVTPDGDAGAFAALTRLVHEWRHFPAIDPRLPAPLLPEGWPGAEAAGAFSTAHATWRAPAWAWWRRSSG